MAPTPSDDWDIGPVASVTLCELDNVLAARRVVTS